MNPKRQKRRKERSSQQEHQEGVCQYGNIFRENGNIILYSLQLAKA